MATKSLTFEIFGKDKTASKALKGVGQQAEHTGGALKGLAKLAVGAFSAKVIADFATQSVMAASDLQEAGTAVQQVFGKDAAAAIKTFADGAHAMGQSKTQALDAAKTFGIFGKAAGLSGQNLSTFSTDFVTLASDLASFNNTSPEQAIEALGAGLRGESEPLRKYGVLLDDATLKAQAMKMGIYDGSGALSQQQRVLAAQQEILAQTGTQQGDFARTSDGLANSARINAANWENFSAKLGKLALPAVTAMSSFMNTHLIPALEKAVKWISSELVPAIRDFSKWVQDNVMWLGPLVSIVIGGVAAFKTYALVMGIVRAATAAWAAIQVVLNVALTANPIGLVIVAIGALVGAIIWVATQTTFFQDAWKFMCRVVQTAWEWLWKNVIKPVADFIVKKFNELVRFGKILGIAIGLTIKQIGGWFGKFKQFVQDAILGAIKWFIALPKRILAALRGAVGWLKQTGKDIISGLINGVTTAAKNVWKTIKNVANNIINGVKKFFGIKSPSTVFASIGGQLMAGLFRGITSSTGKMQGVFSKVFGGVKRTVSGAIGALGGAGASIWESLFGGTKGDFAGGTSRRGGAGGASQWAGIASRVLAMLGQSQSNLPAVLRRINFESGGNPRAINLWDSNFKAGIPSKGLMQTIDPTFNAYAGPFRGLGVYNPLANIYAGLNYAIKRYGSIRAIDPLVRPIGYARGGSVRRTGTYLVGEEGPELVTLQGGSYVTPNHKLGGGGTINVIIQSKGGIDLSKYIEVKIEQADQATARRIRQG